MQARRWMMLRVLLNNFHEGNPDAILEKLPPEEAQKASECRSSLQDYSPAIAMPIEILNKIHYTWLEPIFQKIPESLHAFILAALPVPQAAKLGKLLNKAPVENALGAPVKGFFLDLFYRQFKNPEVLPLEFLPKSPLDVLMNISKEELVELIDLLGVYDLAEEIRHIIDKNVLKTLYLCLSPKKQQFLRICLHHKDKLTSPKLELEHWQGDRQKLELLLHRRGLHRLGKALAGQHADFVWHLTHKLDTGRGEALAKYYTKEEIPGVTPALIQQVFNVLNFLNKKSDS